MGGFWFRVLEHSWRFEYSFEFIFLLTSHYDTSQAIVRKSELRQLGSPAWNASTLTVRPQDPQGIIGNVVTLPENGGAPYD